MTHIKNVPGVFFSIGLGLFFPLKLVAQGSFNFTVIQPSGGAIVADSVAVQVSVNSTYELQSVTAEVDGRSTNLTFSSMGNTWSGTLSLAGLASGQKTLTLTATDVFGSLGQTEETIVRDLPPTVSITEPRSGTVARPDFPLDITAGDDNPDPVIRVYYGATLLASGTNSLIGSASIPNTNGTLATIHVTVTDSAGQSTNVSRDLYVLTGTNWIESCRASGPILDVTSNSVLFADGTALKTKSLISGNETLMLDQPGIQPIAGNFTSIGAVFQTVTEAYDMRNGVLTDLGLCDYGTCSARDDWAVWEHFGSLYLRDELAGTTALIMSSNVVNDFLGPNGQLVYAVNQSYRTWWIYDFSNQMNTLVASNSSYSLSGPQSDGSRLIYEKSPYPATSNSTNYIAAYDHINDSIVATNSGTGPISFAINAGWLAFSATGPTGVNQIWTLAPTGAREQKTFFGNSSTIRALAPDGELMFSSGGQLYLARDGFAPQPVGAWNFQFTDDSGKILWQDGKWWWRLGRSLFQLSQVPQLSAKGDSPGNVKIHVDADPGAQVIIQWSTNLVDWVNLSTNDITGTGTLDFSDSSSFISSVRFYRVLVPNP